MAYASREIQASAPRSSRSWWTRPPIRRGWPARPTIRDIDDDWPSIGSRFHHRVGLRPLTISDNSEVLAVEPDRLLRLAVRARPLISAVVTFTVLGKVSGASSRSKRSLARVRSATSSARCSIQ